MQYMLVTHTDDLLHLQLHTVGSNFFLHFLRFVYDLPLYFIDALLAVYCDVATQHIYRTVGQNCIFSLVVLTVIPVVPEDLKYTFAG